MIGIELFSGAGGMSLGASMAGVDIKMGIDIDKNASATFSHNHPEAIVITDDIRNIKEVPVIVKKDQKILFGGPPCQGFSRSNHRTRNKENPNNWLFEEFVRIAGLWKPDWIVIENVEGILGTEHGLFVSNIFDKLRVLGYTLNSRVLNAMDYGVPQNRLRVFIIGSLNGVTFEFPCPLSTPKVTVKEAISDLPNLNNGNNIQELDYSGEPIYSYAKAMRGNSNSCLNNGVSQNTELVLQRYQHIPQGGNWQNIPKELMTTYKDASRCHTGIYRRLDNNEPSVVIGNYRKNMLIHPNQNRGLSVREAARLQSFPDQFEFKGSLGAQQQQVGNAVPPLLAKAIFSSIISNYN